MKARLQRMQVRPIRQARRGFHRAAFAGLGQRQAGEMRLAVDQHGADAAGALAAAEFGRMSPSPRKVVEQIGAAVDEDRAIRAVVTKLDGHLGHRLRFLQDVSPASSRPRCTGNTSRRYHALTRSRRSRGACLRAPRPPRRQCWLRRAPALERALDRLGAQRRGRHRAIGDPRAADPSAVRRQVRGDRQHRDALRLHPRDLAKAKCISAGWATEADARQPTRNACLAPGARNSSSGIPARRRNRPAPSRASSASSATVKSP